MTEETQQTNTDLEGKTTTSQVEATSAEPENEYEPQGPSKEKSVEQTRTGSHEKSNGRPTQEGIGIDGQNYAFLSYMVDRLEEKIDEKLGESLSQVLDKSLQQWLAQLNKSSPVEAHFPSKKFKKSRDQHEYDAICDAGSLLQKAIQENTKEKVVEAQEALRQRAFVLRVAEEEGWNVAANISRTTFGERLDKTKGVNFGGLGQKTFNLRPTRHLNHISSTHPHIKGKAKQFFKTWAQLTKTHLVARLVRRLVNRLRRLPATIVGEQVIKQQYAHQNLGKEARQVINFFETKAATHESDYTQKKRKTSTTKLMNDSDQGREVLEKIHELQEVRYWIEKIKPPPVVVCWLKNYMPLFPRDVWSLAQNEIQRPYDLMWDQKEWLGKEIIPLKELGAIIKVGSNGTSGTKGHICSGPVEVRGTLEKPEMEVSGSAYSPVEELSKKARALAKNAVRDEQREAIRGWYIGIHNVVGHIRDGITDFPNHTGCSKQLAVRRKRGL
ncbi:1770_t:CDS:2 [Gigaspora rosea]|nr:1770_t:CDS:2 [Gigaspora rosea]